MIETPVLTDIHADYGKFDVTMWNRRVFPTYSPRGPSSSSENGAAIERAPSSFKVRQVTLLHAEDGGPKGGSSRYECSPPLPLARHRIATLSDYNQLQQDNDRIKEITQLGLTYTL